MKRQTLLASFLLFILLCASIAYWGLQLFKPPLRPMAAPPRAAVPEVNSEAAAALFGGRPGKVAVASNYQLRGVIMSGTPRDSVAIVSADGKPAQAVRVGSELQPGVVIKEVHQDYVLLSESGAVKRVELPEDVKGQGGLAVSSPVPVQPRTGTPPPPPPPRGLNMPAPAVSIMNPPTAQPPQATAPLPAPGTTAPPETSPALATPVAPSQVLPSPSTATSSGASGASTSSGASGAPATTPAITPGMTTPTTPAITPGMTTPTTPLSTTPAQPVTVPGALPANPSTSPMPPSNLNVPGGSVSTPGVPGAGGQPQAVQPQPASPAVR